MIRSALDKVWSRLPELPSLGQEVPVPVYVIHSSMDAEDYFFIFDFEQFAEASQGGVFVRPKLRVLAGRDDFDRAIFGRQFREVFSKEFDAMRADLGKDKDRGWLSWDFGWDIFSAAAGFVANVVLLVALGLWRTVVASLPAMLRGKSAEAKLEDQISGLQAAADKALSEIEVELHPDLYDHAFKGFDPGDHKRPVWESWPLPANVESHLSDEESGSWW